MIAPELVALCTDRDLAAQVQIAIRGYRMAVARNGGAEHPMLEPLERGLSAIATGRADSETWPESATGRHEAPGPASGREVPDDGLDDREYLTRDDVRRLTGISLRTIERRIASGELRSRKHGRIRRVTRRDLDVFLQGQGAARR